MKKCFQPKEFGAEAMDLITLSNDIIGQYARQGYDLSLRQLYYQLVTINALRNSQQSYKRLGTIISDARLAGLIDWDAIVDRGRLARKVRTWSGPDKAVEELAKSFRIDYWKDQPIYVEVMVEKQALEGVLIPVCSRYGVRFSSNKGYSSSTALYETSLRIAKACSRGKVPVILYLGDHDPSGIDMTRDIRDRMKMFCGAEVDVKRLALNRSQVDEHQLPPNPAKITDSRSDAYIGKHGVESWELDALKPTILSRILSSAIERRIDRPAWDKSKALEDDYRRKLFSAAASLKAPGQTMEVKDEEDGTNP